MWVFGYGSLIWHPGFEFTSKRLAQLENYRRSFCMRSIHHRGTPVQPGLVLALDRAVGASCRGVAFEVPEAQADQTLDYLRERELISSAYLEQRLPVEVEGVGRVQAVAYVVDATHAQYCQLSLAEQTKIIAQASGGRGSNVEYLLKTAQHLTELGIADADLCWLVDTLMAATPSPPLPASGSAHSPHRH